MAFQICPFDNLNVRILLQIFTSILLTLQIVPIEVVVEAVAVKLIIIIAVIEW